MTKVDIISGFLGAGKTTFIKELINRVYAGEKLVLIENEFGEIGIDGGFLKDAGIEMDDRAFKMLLERCGTDTLLFHHALVRFDLYGKKELDVNDIRHLVPLNPNINVFNLTSGFTSGDLGLAMDTANEMLASGYDYMALISMITKRLRVMYNVRHLSESGLDHQTIANRLHQKKGYVYFVYKDSSRFTSKKLLSLLSQLAQLDQGIKQGKINPRYGFEQFMIRNGME